MSGLNVALSTTDYLAVGSEALKELSLPVCVADMSMGLFGFPNVENFEHFCSEICKDMAKTVVINSEKHTVFIGEDPSDEDSALVFFDEEPKDQYGKAFYSRWDECQILLFEFQIKGTGEDRFCIRGLWVKDHWQFLTVNPSSSVEVI